MENLEIFRKNGFDFLIDEDGGLSTVEDFHGHIWYIFLQLMWDGGLFISSGYGEGEVGVFTYK